MSTVKIYNQGSRTIQFAEAEKSEILRHLKPKTGATVSEYAAALLRKLYPDEVKTAESMFSEFEKSVEDTQEQKDKDGEAREAASTQAPPADKPLTDMNADELRAVAKARGIDVHPKAGAAKILAAISAASEQ